MPVLRNVKHEKFAQEIANGKNSLEAYKCVGFKPDQRNADRLRAREDVGRRNTILHEIDGGRKGRQGGRGENHGDADADFCFAKAFEAAEDGAGLALTDELEIQRA